ncbi:FecR family protein [Pedobacter sp. L105]|uniref:FecR family protein n=1 Tax=Pedobacter sp. L105 TaxID=1641871 RepID=UPI00131E861A|nr:FecR family protein [Pedobacter sp. L105]
MEEDYLKKLVKRYLDKKSTDDELEIFVSLMRAGKLDQYIQEAMDQDIEPDLQKTHTIQRKNIFTRLRWPAAATIALILSLYNYISYRKNQPDTIAKINIINFRNHTANVAKQILPDGSKVWLNPNTLLSYPTKFGKLREVSMEGEAFFEVTKDHSHPFQITSGKILTTVWGTSFRIRSMPDGYAKVSVLTGKVSVSIPEKGRLKTYDVTSHEEVMLLPQEEVTYQQSDRHLVKAPIPAVSDMQIWHKANLSFENTPLNAVAVQLSKYYHVKIDVEGEKLGQYQLTADFTDKNLADILILISKSVHTTYARNDNTIILRTTIKQALSTN